MFLGSNLSSGPNQHYLPKFLQKPFGIRPKRKEIWVFSRDTPPERRKIKRVGSSDYFYSYPARAGERTLDDKITELEDGISKKLLSIRAKPVGATIHARRAAEIIDHLVPRTAHVRLNLARGLRTMADGIWAVLSDDGKLQALIGLDEEEPNEAFRRAIAEKLQQIDGIENLGIPLHVIEKVAIFQAKEHFASLSADILPPLRELFSSWLQRSDGFIRDTHNTVLETVSSSAPRIGLLEELDWSVQAGPPDGAILPDCVAIAYDGAGQSAPAMFADWKRVSAIVLPIAPQKLLVGAASNTYLKNLPDFNCNAAGCSHDFFLAPQNNDYLLELQSVLGERSTQVIDDGIGAALAPYTAALTKEMQDDTPLFPLDLVKGSSKPFQFELSFIGCGEEGELRELSNAIVGVVESLATALPLERLEGITVASNYLEAVASLDRGYENSCAPNVVPEKIGQGVARTILVKRKGHWKTRIVSDSRLALALLTDDEATVNWATYIFTRQLAEVAIPEIMERSLPGIWMSEISDPLHNFLYPSMHPAIVSYLTSHICAGFGDKAQLSADKRCVLMGAIRELKAAVLAARLEYRSHGKLDVLLGIAMPRISYVLQSAADLLGHCCASGEDPISPNGELSEALEDAGLEHWLPIFGDRLERFRLRFGRWESIDEFLVLDLHVERLMWQFGLLPWLGPCGVRVEVPIETDLDELMSDTEV